MARAFSRLSAVIGAGTTIRTRDLLITSQLLYQLSYAGKTGANILTGPICVNTCRPKVLGRNLLPDRRTVAALKFPLYWLFMTDRPDSMTLPDDDTDARSPDPKGELMLRVVPTMADANPIGDISGGWLVTQMDTAAALMAAKIAQGRVTTMAIGDMSFVRPVRVGSVVCCYAVLEHTGRSSLRVSIEVWCRMPEEDRRQKVTEALFTYVAIDEKRRIRPLPASAR